MRESAIRWFHSIALGGGDVTEGVKSPEQLRLELTKLELPEDLSGQSVLDIGAWDGYFSFEMERRGARVVALDNDAWAINHAAREAYHQQMRANGQTPRPPEEVPHLWDLDALPGRRGFDYARARLHSRVEPVVGDFMTMDLEALGVFDLVLFLGVLYHLKDPFLGLRRLRSVTAEHAVIETSCLVLPGQEHRALWQFFEATELDADPTNWWTPNLEGLVTMCRAAGFAKVTPTRYPLPDAPASPGHDIHYGRAVIHAYA